MTAATPIKSIRAIGLSIFAVDFAGHTDLQATCPDHDRALWLGSCLAQYHMVPFETADHGLETPETVWKPSMGAPAGFWTTPASAEARGRIIQEAADRLNGWLAKQPAGTSSPESVIGKLRSYAAE